MYAKRLAAPALMVSLLLIVSMSAVLEHAEESDGFSETCPFCRRTFTDPDSYIEHVYNHSQREFREWNERLQKETINYMLIANLVLCLVGYWYYSLKKEREP